VVGASIGVTGNALLKNPQPDLFRSISPALTILGGKSFAFWRDERVSQKIELAIVGASIRTLLVHNVDIFLELIRAQT
jgi:hypothetical protein